MKSCSVCVLLVVVLVTVQSTHGRYLARQKRVSDQRLAEIETLLALSKYRGMLSTVPVGYGRVDPDKLGRRRRAAASQLWRELLLDDQGDDSMTSDDSGELVDDDATAMTSRGGQQRRSYRGEGEAYRLVRERRRAMEGETSPGEVWGSNLSQNI